jgi:hypothetical protein
MRPWRSGRRRLIEEGRSAGAHQRLHVEVLDAARHELRRGGVVLMLEFLAS